MSEMQSFLIQYLLQVILIGGYGWIMYRAGHHEGLKQGIRAVLTLQRILRANKSGGE